MRLAGPLATTICQRVADGTFPRPVLLDGRATGWRAEGLRVWFQACHSDR